MLRTEPITDPKIVADLPATFESTNASWSSDGLGRVVRAVKAYNRTLLAAGYTDEQIVGIVNTAIKECGDDLTVDPLGVAREQEVATIERTYTAFNVAQKSPAEVNWLASIKISDPDKGGLVWPL